MVIDTQGHFCHTLAQKRKFLLSIVLIVVSLILSVCVVEGLLRVMLKPDRLYSALHTQPEWSAWKSRVKFWQNHDRNVSTYPGFDPDLGWDTVDPQHYRQHHPVAPFSQTVVAIGDSFTYGNDVAKDENFPFLLDGLLDDIRVLNMGVPGYGLDQAYLKYLKHGEQHQPVAVIFGIYVGDYERTSTSFTVFAKPRFVVGPTGVVLTNQPVPPPDEMLAVTEREFAGRWYTAELLANVGRKIAETQSTGAAYYEATDEVIQQILESLQDRLADTRLIIVHIPRKKAFVERNDDQRGEMSRRLLAIYQRLDLEVLDLRTYFVETLQPDEVFASHYVHFERGSVGHLSPVGNLRVAEGLAELLTPSGSRY